MIKCVTVTHYLEAMRDAMKSAVMQKRAEKSSPAHVATPDAGAEIEGADAAKMEDPGEAHEEETLEEDPVDDDAVEDVE